MLYGRDYTISKHKLKVKRQDNLKYLIKLYYYPYKIYSYLKKLFMKLVLTK